VEEALMARGSTYRVPPRRRREGKTDYQARKALVLSGKSRLVARSTVRNVVAQIVAAKPYGDEVLASAHSRELKKFGWKATMGNVPAAYLTGLLCGLKAKAKGVEAANLDIGLVSPTKGAKVFAVLSGVLDAGVDVPHDEEKIVKERMKGEHIAQYAKSLRSDSEEYAAKFSQYLEQKLDPEKLPEHFAKVKADIVGSFKQEVKVKKSEKKTVRKKRVKKA
jgi:large subunit ribosomal protein L18